MKNMDIKKENRTVEFSFRLTPTENEIFTNNVKKALVSSKAQFLRKLALNDIILSRTDNENFRKLLQGVGAVGKAVGMLRVVQTALDEYEISYDTYLKRITELINEFEDIKTELKDIIKQLEL